MYYLCYSMCLMGREKGPDHLDPADLAQVVAMPKKIKPKESDLAGSYEAIAESLKDAEIPAVYDPRRVEEPAELLNRVLNQRLEPATVQDGWVESIALIVENTHLMQSTS